MATIDKKLVHFNKEEYFNNALKNGQIKDTSIVFIGDHDTATGKKIYTHGETYITNYEGTAGVAVKDNKIGLISDNLLFFETTIALDEFIETIGGEDELPIPCVIFVDETGAVIYNE